jgi:GTPase SAR1 family protein
MSRIHIPTGSPVEEQVRSARRVLYARPDEVPDVWTDERIDRFWTDELSARLRADEDALVLVWGPAGSGKSTFVLDRVRKLDPTLTPDNLAERVAFRPEHIPELYRRAPRYGAVWVDEAVSAGLLSTDTHDEDQKDLVQLINTIRAKNLCLFVLLPSAGDLAKSFRARRADYRVEVHKPVDPTGPRYAYVGRKVHGREFYLPDGRWLGFDDDKRANPVTFHDYRTSPDPTERALWARYFELKSRYLDENIDTIAADMARRAEARAKRRERRERRA